MVHSDQAELCDLSCVQSCLVTCVMEVLFGLTVVPFDAARNVNPSGLAQRTKTGRKIREVLSFIF